MSEEASAVLEELTRAARDYVWERQRRVHRSVRVPNIGDDPYYERLLTATRRAEDVVAVSASRKASRDGIYGKREQGE